MTLHADTLIPWYVPPCACLFQSLKIIPVLQPHSQAVRGLRTRVIHTYTHCMCFHWLHTSLSVPPHNVVHFNYRIAGHFWGWKFSRIGHFECFCVLIFEESPVKWSHTHKWAMCLHMRTRTLNVFDGAKYFSKAISISISISHSSCLWNMVQLKFAMRTQRSHRGHKG